MAPDDRREATIAEYSRDDDEPISYSVTRAIVTDQHVTKLQPLTRVIDADALDALFPPRRSDDDERWVKVSFTYEGFRVEIEADGTVRLLGDPEEED